MKKKIKKKVSKTKYSISRNIECYTNERVKIIRIIPPSLPPKKHLFKKKSKKEKKGQIKFGRFKKIRKKKSKKKVKKVTRVIIK